MGSRAGGSVPIIVVLPSEIDATSAEQAFQELFKAFATGAAVVIADLTATFCDSSGMRHLLNAHAHAVSVGAQLRLAVSPGGAVARVVELMALGKVLPVYTNTADATAA